MKQINIKMLAIVISLLLAITIFLIAFSNIFTSILYLLWLSFIIFAFVLVKELLTINKIIKFWLYIFIIMVLFTGLGFINTLWPILPIFTETKIHDQGKVCFSDGDCLKKYCIPDDIKCKTNCSGTCSSVEKNYCDETGWYYIDSGTVKRGQGYACSAD